MIVFLVLKIRFFVRRKHQIDEITGRLKNKKAFREFISQLNLLVREVYNTDGRKFILKLDRVFRLFLENQFIVFALKEKPEKIIREIKRYYPFIEKDKLEAVLVFFSETEKLSSEKVSSKDCEQMLNQAREIAISFLETMNRRFN